MSDFFYRTEDFRPRDTLKYFVETPEDRDIISELKNRTPTVLVGSRGVGKSFLMRVAEQELLQNFEEERIVPVFLTFVSSSLLQTDDPDQFQHWMIARICRTVLRTIKKMGLIVTNSENIRILSGVRNGNESSSFEKIVDDFEQSWKNPGQGIDVTTLPTVEELKEVIEDLAEELNIKRFSLFMDEAAHVFLPHQQRQFFTLFRDLRSYCLICNAAVYPGVTSFGDAFQPTHDARMISINRDIGADNYVGSMREIVEKQSDSKFLKMIARNGENFSVMAYAATGNPRTLLKTLSSTPKLSSSEVNATIKVFYRGDIWSEHTALGDKYSGHKPIIDWGRTFVEDTVLPDLKQKNDAYLENDKNSTSFVWIQRDAPEIVKESLRLLCYTGILTEHNGTFKATRAQIGKRFTVNLGCLFALEPSPASTSFEIARALTPKRMAEFGNNHNAYSWLLEQSIDIDNIQDGFELSEQLDKPNTVLDITEYQLQKLNELELFTVRDVLSASEDKLKEAHYIGDVRAQQMRNAAIAAVLEYLSG